MRLTNITLLFLLLFSSCMEGSSNEKSDLKTSILSNKVSKKELYLDKDKGIVYHNKIPFSGISVLKYGNGILAETIMYIDGRKQYETKKWFYNGRMSYITHYLDGKQNGISKTWWKNGILRTEATYKNGKVHGVQKQWYKSGEIFKEMNIEYGKEVGLQRAWRENGKIYNNYEAKNGRIFGLKRSKLCFKLQEEDVKNDN